MLIFVPGHYFALDDFYDWTPSNVGGFLMKAGSATQITDFDGWMMRDWWRNLKSRYALRLVEGNSTASYTGTVPEVSRVARVCFRVHAD